MPRRKCKGKQDIFLRQCRRQRPRPHIVSHKNDVLRPVRSQGIQRRIQLRIAQDHKNHIIPVIRRKRGHHRNAADRRAKRKLILDPQTVFSDLLRPISPCKQGDVLSSPEQIPCQIAAQNACAVYQNFHCLPPNPIFTICIFIWLSPTLARKRKKPLTDGSRRSL